MKKDAPAPLRGKLFLGGDSTQSMYIVSVVPNDRDAVQVNKDLVAEVETKETSATPR